MTPSTAAAPVAGRLDARVAGAAVGRLFEEHGRMVHALCRLRLRHREEAEDATQQTFLEAYRSMLRGVNPDEPGAWLATIARNECYRRLGRRAPETTPLLDADGGADPARVVDSRTEMDALYAALVELPSSQRQAVVLREFYGLSYSEVAAALGVSGPAVESLLFKSRRRLRDRLRPLRAPAGVALPLAVRHGLEAGIPGFAGQGAAAAGTGAGAGLLTNLAAGPLAAKVTAAAVAVVAGTTVGVVERPQRPALHASEPKPHTLIVQRSGADPTAPQAEGAHLASAPTLPAATTRTRHRSGSGSQQPEHRNRRDTPAREAQRPESGSDRSGPSTGTPGADGPVDDASTAPTGAMPSTDRAQAASEPSRGSDHEPAASADETAVQPTDHRGKQTKPEEPPDAAEAAPPPDEAPSSDAPDTAPVEPPDAAEAAPPPDEPSSSGGGDAASSDTSGGGSEGEGSD